MTLPRFLVAPVGFVSLALAAAAATAAVTRPAAPLHLVTEPAGSGVRIRIVGHSPVVCEARYSLEVANRSGGGTSRSVQRGAARLRPGVVSNVATVTLGNAAAAGWTARLVVDPCGPAKRYEEVIGPARSPR